MAATMVGIGVGLVLLVLAATGLAVAFATRGAMAGNREVVDVLHVVGARDGFIAREFGGRFFRLGLKGGAIGGAAALGVVVGLSLLSASWRASAAGDQLESLFGTFEISPRGLAAVVLVALTIAAVSAAVSRWTVRRFLAGTR
jgi:cell division transport system permease protein